MSQYDNVYKNLQRFEVTPPLNENILDKMFQADKFEMILNGSNEKYFKVLKKTLCSTHQIRINTLQIKILLQNIHHKITVCLISQPQIQTLIIIIIRKKTKYDKQATKNKISHR